MAKKNKRDSNLKEGVDFVWVKNPNSNTRGRKMLTASEKAAMRTAPPKRPEKASAPSTRTAPAKPRVNANPPSRPVNPTPASRSAKSPPSRPVNPTPPSAATKAEPLLSQLARSGDYVDAMSRYTEAQASRMTEAERKAKGLPPNTDLYRGSYRWKSEDTSPRKRPTSPGNRTALERLKAEQGYNKGGMVKKGKKC